MNFQIRSKLVENIALTQEIHALNHTILDIQFNYVEKSRKHWTNSEDSLLNQAVAVFGVNDLSRLQKILISKTKSQIYFRIRYIIENTHLLKNKCLPELVQHK
ncbi:SANT/Myb_domain [Hexamita inflata]|uniref:SANT/Myb domain n=1 Tax=Hexamita inflata TaxID=28002 RepID=A0AA86PMX0_9EUKA|nr:SANT/Myb domain [Hexamita inflata]